MALKLDKYEEELEDNISLFAPVSSQKQELIENIIDKANAK